MKHLEIGGHSTIVDGKLYKWDGKKYHKYIMINNCWRYIEQVENID